MNHQPTVLVVEDNAVVRKIADMNLRRFNVLGDFAENGEEAVEKFRQNEYDLILMDVAMPVMNGMRATELIRSAERFSGRRRVPIVAITASAEEAECLDAGMDDYITKPPDYARVLRRWLPDWFADREQGRVSGGLR
jgi:CheY-like chemotaxis protein